MDFGFNYSQQQLIRRGPPCRYVFASASSMCFMIRLALALALAIPAGAQIVPGLEIPPSGNNQKASVTQQIGPVRVYHRLLESGSARTRR